MILRLNYNWSYDSTILGLKLRLKLQFYNWSYDSTTEATILRLKDEMTRGQGWMRARERVGRRDGEAKMEGVIRWARERSWGWQSEVDRVRAIANGQEGQRWREREQGRENRQGQWSVGECKRFTESDNERVRWWEDEREWRWEGEVVEGGERGWGRGWEAEVLTEREVGRGSVVLREGERQKKDVWVRARWSGRD